MTVIFGGCNNDEKQTGRRHNNDKLGFDPRAGSGDVASVRSFIDEDCKLSGGGGREFILGFPVGPKELLWIMAEISAYCGKTGTPMEG